MTILNSDGVGETEPYRLDDSFFWADFLNAVRFFLGKSNIVQVCSSLPHNPWIKSKLKRQEIEKKYMD